MRRVTLICAIAGALLVVPVTASEPLQPPLEGPDLVGLKRDTAYFIGYQLAITAVLYAMPGSVTKFDRDDASLGKWKHNVTHPQWDTDDPFINYVMHPYWGAAYYVRGRERRLDRLQAFGYAAFMSALYEYGAEALFEPVSYQDLIVTPLGGWLLGEYVFLPWRAHVLAKPSRSTLDRTVLALTDPLGAMNELTDRVFGVPTQVSVGWSPSSRRGRFVAAAPRLPGDAPGGGTWWVRLEVRW